MAESQSVTNELNNQALWSKLFHQIADWFQTSLASTDTLIELAIIVAAAIMAWPVANYLKQQIQPFGQKHSANPLLSRLWLTLARIVFPLIWLMVQLIAEVVIEKLGYRHTMIVIASSLITAWVVINMVAVFVANPLASKFIALTAWLVAALNIVGLLDKTLQILAKTALTLGQVSISVLAIIQGVAALAILLWATALAGQLIEGRLKRSPHLTPSLQVLSAKLLRIGLAIMAFIFALSIVGIDLTAFAVLGGAIGVGLGFGLQKIFANLISGFILLIDKSIKPGDVITIGEDYGKVDSLGARYVSVLTRDGIEHLIPNEELITTKVENWSHSNSLLRLRKMIGVHYKADVRKAMGLCFEAMAETKRIMKDPAPNCLLRDFADSSVNIEMRFWINDPMNGIANVTSELLLNVWDKLHEHNIEIPYPQRDLHLRSSEVISSKDFNEIIQGQSKT
ncbi:mechanosensitive ion channel family protein [Aliikangiella sp. IMCC44359]|uniref:mechanosensitive ion channel family protein n=1 Tax=Aliikangiella sp. IMCC44359 TaxID=3459125 RepID=UPI00403ACF26